LPFSGHFSHGDLHVSFVNIYTVHLENREKDIPIHNQQTNPPPREGFGQDARVFIEKITKIVHFIVLD
jgi:hypothetical protein